MPCSGLADISAASVDLPNSSSVAQPSLNLQRELELSRANNESARMQINAGHSLCVGSSQLGRDLSSIVPHPCTALTPAKSAEDNSKARRKLCSWKSLSRLETHSSSLRCQVNPALCCRRLLQEKRQIHSLVCRLAHGTFRTPASSTATLQGP